MKKNILFLSIFLLLGTGCSKTWSGIKQDSVDVLDSTREAIHEATAPSNTVPVTNDNTLSPLPNIPAPEANVEVIKEQTMVTTVQ